MKTFSFTLFALIALTILSINISPVTSSCPFDDSSCQDTCKEQGCNMGYCGHFAWIQCICRKCGKEWEWYDTVRVNEGKQVNQTELESLKLNTTNAQINQQANGEAANKLQELSKAQAEAASREAARARGEQQHASLASMLIPDLTDNSKFEDTDIPEENSERFLDFLAKNHERLAKASSVSQVANQQQSGRGTGSQHVLPTSATASSSNLKQADTLTLNEASQPTNSGSEDPDEAIIEIQIKTIKAEKPQSEAENNSTTPTTTTATPQQQSVTEPSIQISNEQQNKSKLMQLIGVL